MAADSLRINKQPWTENTQDESCIFFYNLTSKVTSCPFCHILLIRSEPGSGVVVQWLEYLSGTSEALGHREGREGKSVGPCTLMEGWDDTVGDCRAEAPGVISGLAEGS